MICEKCGKEHDGSFGTGRFCSRNCANAHSFTTEQREKISRTVKNIIRKRMNDVVCIKCGKHFQTKDLSRKMCKECLPTTIKRNKHHREKTSEFKEPKSIQDVSSRTASKILKRLQLPCSCCGIYYPGIIWDIHHIISKKDGGIDNMTNLTYICPTCHRIAHTDKSLLPGELLPIEEQLKKLGKNWLDYYYG